MTTSLGTSNEALMPSEEVTLVKDSDTGRWESDPVVVTRSWTMSKRGDEGLELALDAVIHSRRCEGLHDF